VEQAFTQKEAGVIDVNRYVTIAQDRVTQQDSSAQARGQIAQGLIAIYRAMGGGWEIRLANGAWESSDLSGVVEPLEEVPAPAPKATDTAPAPAPPVPDADTPR